MLRRFPLSNHHRQACGRSGGATLEMMLVLPILIMLTFGVIDYGYYMYVRTTLQGAAAAGCRAGVPVSAAESNVTSVISTMMTGAGITSYTVTTSPTDVSTASLGTTITVTVSASWGTIGTHMLGTAWGGISNSKNVIGTASMLKE